MPDTFVPAGPLRANPIYDGRPNADPFSGPRPGGRITLDSSADLFAFVNQGASVAPDRGPYSLTSAQLTRGGKAEDVTLVAINGTHIGWAKEARQSTGIMTDLRAGVGFENAYVRSVKADLMALPQGTKVVIAGHSLGGIVAQEIAADPDIRARLQVLNTVTFGAPPIKPGRQEGAVHRLVDAHDPIPLLSWDAVKSNVSTTVDGALRGGQDAIDRVGDVYRQGGVRGLFSRDMARAVLGVPGAIGDGAVRGVQRSDVFASTTMRDAGMDEGAAGIPGTDTYLSFRAHSQSYNDPRTWGGVTALGEDHSAATRATLTFKEGDVRWRMTEPVLTHPAWSLPILDRLRPFLSEVDPSQTAPGLPGSENPASRLARADGDAPTPAVPGENVRTALAMVLQSDDGVPAPDALAGTRPQQLAAVRDVMAGRGIQATPEQAAAVLDLAGTLDPPRPGTDQPGAESDATRLARADRAVPASGPSV